MTGMGSEVELVLNRDWRRYSSSPHDGHAALGLGGLCQCSCMHAGEPHTLVTNHETIRQS
jgi:hypothetical protein